MRLLRSKHLVYNRQHLFSVAQIEVCRLYDQDQLSAGNAGLLRDFLLNEVEHHKVDIIYKSPSLRFTEASVSKPLGKR